MWGASFPSDRAVDRTVGGGLVANGGAGSKEILYISDDHRLMRGPFSGVQPPWASFLALDPLGFEISNDLWSASRVAGGSLWP